MFSIPNIKKTLKNEPKREGKISRRDMLSAGATLVNLACSGMPRRAFYKGMIALLIGDSDTGKSVMSMSCLAEAAKNKRYKNYRFIHDNTEGGVLMDIEDFYGKTVARRLSAPPRGVSETVEEFYRNLDELYEANEPFIYILDSMDAIESEEDIKKDKKRRKAIDAGREDSGTYGLAKAKANSRGLRRAAAKLPKTGSILIIIMQSRDNIGLNAKFAPKTRAGGRALKFYARLEMWTSPAGELTKNVKGKNRQIGIKVQVKVKKNHFNGKKRTVIVPIYNSLGFDDTGSCVDFLVEEKHWKKRGGKIVAPEFDAAEKREKLIRFIESENKERELQDLVAQVWDEIEQACVVKRKRRYE